jgi:hypothetical protein
MRKVFLSAILVALHLLSFSQQSIDVGTEGVRGEIKGMLTASQLFTVDLDSEKSYVISMTGQFDTYLKLFDVNEELVASDDDSGSDYNARIIYAAQQSGQHIIAATRAGDEDGSGLGPFHLTIREVSSFIADGKPRIVESLEDDQLPLVLSCLEDQKLRFNLEPNGANLISAIRIYSLSEPEKEYQLTVPETMESLSCTFTLSKGSYGVVAESSSWLDFWDESPMDGAVSMKVTRVN